MKKIIIWAAVLACGGYFGSKMLLHHKVESGIDTVFLVMSPYVNIEYDGVSSTMGGTLTIDGIRAQIPGFDDEVRIARLGIDTPSYFTLLNLTDIVAELQSPGESIPEHFGVIAEGIRIPVSADYLLKSHRSRLKEVGADDIETPAAQCAGKYGFSPDTLSGLGYTEQIASISARFRRGVGKYSVEIASSIDDMWSVDVELTLDGDLLAEMANGSRYRPKMRAMRIEYQDQSLNGRVQEYCGRLGLSPAETLAAQLDTLHFFGQENGIEFDELVLKPYTEFLRGKPNLLVTAKPSKPVSLTQISLYKPSDVPALLDLSAEAF